ncbi:MAG TPA: pilus assembly protein TadG-related protein [Planctomycetaceae bacterium]|jgi:Flp pilus assembly protein TadG|nr:pilus assembly protein TadG-related protein [Planctomycetaceae bacterium]
MKSLRRFAKIRRWSRRRGNMVAMFALLLVPLCAFTAFAVDIGYISITRTQLQGATDGSALAAALQLGPGLGPGNNPTQTTVASNGRTAASAVASANPNGDKSSVYLNTSDGIQFGRRYSNGTTWINSWGTQPYNLVSVTANRGTGNSSAGDSPLPLFFARLIGNKTANLSVTSHAALLPGVGFSIGANSNLTSAPILPIAYDETSWNQLLAGVGSDAYSYNSSTGAVTAGSDGVLEIDLYPYGNQSLTPGNRGTVKIGVSNNSTATLSDQILNGVSIDQLATIGGSITIPNGSSITLGGNPGLSAAIKSPLTAIIGQPRAIPIFRSVSGPGNNAQYQIVKFVGIRILDVQLTGGTKYVKAQPAVLMSETVTYGTATNVSDYIYTKPKLVN